MDWKHDIRPFEHGSSDDAIVAAQRIQADDGQSTGIIFQRQLPVWQPHSELSASVDEFEGEFAL
jgi:hypothetical protein